MASMPTQTESEQNWYSLSKTRGCKKSKILATVLARLFIFFYNAYPENFRISKKRGNFVGENNVIPTNHDAIDPKRSADP